VQDAVSFEISGYTARFRLATYFRGLRRPRGWAPIALMFLFPFAVDGAASLMMPGESMFLTSLAIGAGGALSLIALGVLVSVLRVIPPRTITFDDEGIRERVRGKTIAHPWTWIRSALEDDLSITLHCERPMRSFRLASSAHALILVIDKANPGAERLRALLHRHASGAVHGG
jgi:hypothetical protein